MHTCTGSHFQQLNYTRPTTMQLAQLRKPTHGTCVNKGLGNYRSSQLADENAVLYKLIHATKS